MITNLLVGGLGNQLFQISAGYTVAKIMKTDYVINYKIVGGPGQGKQPLIYKNNLYSKILETEKENWYLYNQKGFNYKKLPERDNMCLCGYFQSEKFFLKCKNEIKNLFFFPEYIKKDVNNQMSKFKKKTVGVHLRRGDYKKEIHKTIHPIQSIDYIIKAKSFFNHSEVDFILFTDDFETVSKEININNFHLLKNSSEIHDLYALSQCDSIIMANSSFSWWGSYLGKKKEKVIAPKLWFGKDGPYPYDDIYKDDWIII